MLTKRLRQKASPDDTSSPSPFPRRLLYVLFFFPTVLQLLNFKLHIIVPEMVWSNWAKRSQLDQTNLTGGTWKRTGLGLLVRVEEEINDDGVKEVHFLFVRLQQIDIIAGKMLLSIAYAFINTDKKNSSIRYECMHHVISTN